jgi:hydroxylysine kinase
VDDLESGMLHGDFNEQNILVRPSAGGENEFEIFSAIDFGDSQRSCYVYDLAIAIVATMTICHPDIDPVSTGGHCLAGYLKVKKMKQLDLSLLK